MHGFGSGNSAIARRVQQARDAGRNARPFAETTAQYLLREAQRRAPRGASIRGTGLRNSLNVRLLDDYTIQLVSDKRYARVQNEGTSYLPGGAIKPGGPLKAKMLVVPISAYAQTYIAWLGESVSLRDGPIKMFIWTAPSGRMFLARIPEEVPKGPPRRDRRGRVLHAISQKHGLELMFMLLPQTQLEPNPPPQGFAPRLTEPAVANRLSQFARKHFGAPRSGS